MMSYFNWSKTIIDMIETHHSCMKDGTDEEIQLKNKVENLLEEIQAVQMKSIDSIMFKAPEIIKEYEYLEKIKLIRLLTEFKKQNIISKTLFIEIKEYIITTLHLQ